MQKHPSFPIMEGPLSFSFERRIPQTTLSSTSLVFTPASLKFLNHLRRLIRDLVVYIFSSLRKGAVGRIYTLDQLALFEMDAVYSIHQVLLLLIWTCLSTHAVSYSYSVFVKIL